jgi:DNA-binding winged helix-turn-helix (wHTH) protein
MLLRFASLELDDEKRIFRSPAGEIALQPRIFDLLVHLIRNRDRVVSKIELMDAVWEGAFVTDSAVQRAMSVLRAILREGGAEGAIRTYPRQGYRFCADIDDSPGASVVPTSDTSDRSKVLPGASGNSPRSAVIVLESARAALERDDWAAAAAAFREADRQGGLEGADLERWGEAADALGEGSAALLPLQRAVAAYSAAGAPRDAARCALRLANLQLERRELAVAGGWLRRAERYLAACEPCHELALLEWLRSRVHLFQGEFEQTLDRATAAWELACRIGDRDVEALALLNRGLALLSLAEVRPGVELLDEAGAAVVSENIGRWAGGSVYCGVIWGCLNRGDWRRAAEWTDQFTRWCSLNGICGYPGLCRLHRAEVLSLQGNMIEAEAEVEAAMPELARATPVMEGDAHRVLGDIRLARGDLDGAEESFRRAHELGWDPNPGYALLRAARGQVAEGLRALEDALNAHEWSVRQRRGFILSHLVVLAIQAGKTERARQALAELDQHPEIWETEAARASVAQARGEFALHEGDSASAAKHFRKSIVDWRDVGSACRMAAVRLRLAAALAAQGDQPGAEMEIAAAQATFSHLGLERLFAQCAEIRRALAGA